MGENDTRELEGVRERLIAWSRVRSGGDSGQDPWSVKSLLTLRGSRGRGSGQEGRMSDTARSTGETGGEMSVWIPKKGAGGRFEVGSSRSPRCSTVGSGLVTGQCLA